jgi:hypothetical protein
MMGWRFNIELGVLRKGIGNGELYTVKKRVSGQMTQLVGGCADALLPCCLTLSLTLTQVSISPHFRYHRAYRH